MSNRMECGGRAERVHFGLGGGQRAAGRQRRATPALPARAKQGAGRGGHVVAAALVGAGGEGGERREVRAGATRGWPAPTQGRGGAPCPVRRWERERVRHGAPRARCGCVSACAQILTLGLNAARRRLEGTIRAIGPGGERARARAPQRVQWGCRAVRGREVAAARADARCSLSRLWPL